MFINGVSLVNRISLKSKFIILQLFLMTFIALMHHSVLVVQAANAINLPPYLAFLNLEEIVSIQWVVVLQAREVVAFYGYVVVMGDAEHQA
jgi:hypothetical protein